jgi:hypothetical protein
MRSFFATTGFPRVIALDDFGGFPDLLDHNNSTPMTRRRLPDGRAESDVHR